MFASPYWVAYRTIVIKEIRRFSRIWMQTVLPPVITTTLYFIIFGRLIGGKIGPMGGVDYINYIVPGLVLMAVITNSYANVVSSFYQAKFQHHIEELLVSPAPHWVILAGFISGGVARGVTVGSVVLAVSCVFAEPHLHSIPMTLLVFVLTSALFALGGFINAIYANSFDDITIIPNFVLTPLTYLGGVFYSIDLLSPFWQQVSLFNPILYMVNAFRYGLLGLSDIPVGIALTMTLIFITALTLFSLRLLTKGIGIKT
ncbi:MAG: ABC transporter permease [Gammaproteobacteria bacterium RIFOXYA12_FULL_61_12]|nr:MAG: ABC transporter permease [Gammaproteobacteria bacterium RIFOXYD12_FULL_61_37]OGT90211.1 MAG: ABC transporter permease [Gammaproteobacteria bacterium RIFOXYA12_FULL_61_12]